MNTVEPSQHIKLISKLLDDIDPNEDLFKSKLKLLSQLLVDPHVGHIIDKPLIEWCNTFAVTDNHCEDRTSWWTCKLLKV